MLQIAMRNRKARSSPDVTKMDELLIAKMDAEPSREADLEARVTVLSILK